MLYFHSIIFDTNIMEILLGSALKILVGTDVMVENTNGCQHKYENSKTNKQFVFLDLY